MHQVNKFLEKFFRGIGTDFALQRLAVIAASGVAGAPRAADLNPSDYTCPVSYKWDQACVEITRKLLLPGDTALRRQNAIDTFWAAEAQCCHTNTHLNRFFSASGPFSPTEHHVMDFINLWRKEISRVLGKLPDRLDPAFSGGSTLSDSGTFTTIPDKMSSQRTVYKDCIDIYKHSIKGTFLERDYQPEMVVVRSNRFFTVPKDSEKDRGCCMEASAALSLQLAVGRFLKERYRKLYKVDLKHAKEIHVRMAQASSITQSHATIDLSNASDTVARDLVKLVLPPDWFALLNSLRATHTEIDGREIFLEKFSSMGNGFTFELETILFRTLCAALGAPRDECFVFGDDIIVPTSLSRAAVAALRFFGFTPNKRKTFCEGPFRESCGGDFFLGVNVRSHYLKELPDEPQHWVALANGLRRLDPCLHRLHAAWRFCIDQLPTAWRNFGPAYLGDGVIHDPEATPSGFTYRTDERKPQSSRLIGWRIMRPIGETRSLDRYDPHTQLGSILMGCDWDVSLRDSVTGYKHAWVPAYGIDWLPKP